MCPVIMRAAFIAGLLNLLTMVTMWLGRMLLIGALKRRLTWTMKGLTVWLRLLEAWLPVAMQWRLPVRVRVAPWWITRMNRIHTENNIKRWKDADPKYESL